MRVFSMLSSLILSDIGALLSDGVGSTFPVSALAMSKLAAPLFKKMILARASVSCTFLMMVSLPLRMEAMSITKPKCGASMRVSLAKESLPTICKWLMPTLKLGKLRIKPMDTSLSKCTVALRFSLAAFCMAPTILPLNAKGNKRSKISTENSEIPAILRLFFQFMVVVFAKILCKGIVCRGETFKVDYKRLNRFGRPKPQLNPCVCANGLAPALLRYSEYRNRTN